MTNMIIDTDNYAEHGIEVFQFPGGEWHANVPSFEWSTLSTVHAKLRSWDDLGKLLAVGSALTSQHVQTHLFCPYFPGMRQDRNPGGNTPPTFVVHGSRLRSLPESYRRYLENFFRKRFKLVGTPVRFVFKEGENPYKDKKNVLTEGQQAKRRRLMRHVKKNK